MAFDSNARGYLAAGIPVIPVGPDKRPLVREWSRWCKEPLDTGTLEAWCRDYPGAGLGIPLGTASGLVAVDIDVEDAELIASLPRSACGKRGAKGETWFYRYSGTRSSGGLYWRGEKVGDFLSTGRQSVIPPSFHQKAGRPYVWLGSPLLDSLDALEVLPDGFFDAFMPIRKPLDTVPFRCDFESGDIDLDTAAEALAYVSSDNREVWVQIGMALKHAFGNAALHVWDSWSRNSSKYVPGETARLWNGFNGNGITLGTLIYHAKQAGWASKEFRSFQVVERPRATYEPPATVDIYQPPGLVGRIHRWMLDTAMYPHPELCLAGAISCTGTIMAHRAKFFTGLRTNIYTLALADSGEGKGHPKHCILRLLKDTGYKQSIIGPPKSDAGLFSALHSANGAGIIVYDEYGRVLDAITGRNAAAHQKGLMTLKVDLYTESEGELIGAQYANHDGKHNRVDIDQPCLSIAAMTVPERFFASLSDNDAIDGFLSRWLVFNVDHDQERPPRVIQDRHPPMELVQEVMGWLGQSTNVNPQGNMPAINPPTIPCAPGVEDVFWAFSNKCYQKKRTATELSSKSIWSRMAASAAKLALLAAEDGAITHGAMQWGITVATERGKWLMDAVNRYVSSNENEAEVKKMLRILQDAGKPLTKSEIIRKTQWLKSQRRDEIIKSLVESGGVEQTSHTTRNNREQLSFSMTKTA